ncbi:hypothetical protein [Catellatospora sp. NPDC049133]|uniref:hypothetical protein n=1 Tax=Catellatospora sp. NPDC049133 TaxID=3155499 RepID=UPI003402D2F3
MGPQPARPHGGGRLRGYARRRDRLVAWTRQGPELAIVDDVAVFEESPEGLSGFDIRPTA